jgi:signal transduction histidine kinase
MVLSRLDRQLSGLRTYNLDESVILNDLVNDIAEEYAALAITANLQLRSQIYVSNALEVIGNSEQLYRLVSNLVANAIDYTPAGGEVTVILKSTRTEAIIEVRDMGIGIAKPEQKKIFDRFYRVNSDRSRQTGGSGLGLAIAQAIAFAHRGTIEVESDLGIGSTFIVRLPKLENS